MNQKPPSRNSPGSQKPDVSHYIRMKIPVKLVKKIFLLIQCMYTRNAKKTFLLKINGQYSDKFIVENFY